MHYFYNELYLLALSHDEVVHGKKTVIDKLWGTYEEKCAQLRTLYFYMYAHPGKKLNFMGNELGHFREWDEKRELDWDLLKYPFHDAFQKYFGALSRLYATQPALYAGEYDPRCFEWVASESRDEGVYAWLRKGAGQTILCVMNTQNTAHKKFPLYLSFPAGAEELLNTEAPGWGGAFISIAIIISILGSWLSFTILPAETTSEMADYKLLPASWGKLNSHNAPSMSLLIVGACTQAFLIVLLFSAALRLRVLHVHRGHRHHLGFAAAYQAKWGVQNKNMVQAAIGFVAVAFQVIGVLFNGWSFLLLTCVGYIPGFFIYVKARKDYGNAITMGEKVCMASCPPSACCPSCCSPWASSRSSR